MNTFPDMDQYYRCFSEAGPPIDMKLDSVFFGYGTWIERGYLVPPDDSQEALDPEPKVHLIVYDKNEGKKRILWEGKSEEDRENPYDKEYPYNLWTQKGIDKNI